MLAQATFWRPAQLLGGGGRWQSNKRTCPRTLRCVVKSCVAGNEVHRRSGSMMLYLSSGECRVWQESLEHCNRRLRTGRGEHLDDDVPIVTPLVQQAEQAADAADAHNECGQDGNDFKGSCED